MNTFEIATKIVNIPINPKSDGDNNLAKIIPIIKDNDLTKIFSIEFHKIPLRKCLRTSEDIEC